MVEGNGVEGIEKVKFVLKRNVVAMPGNHIEWGSFLLCGEHGSHILMDQLEHKGGVKYCMFGFCVFIVSYRNFEITRVR